jgi:hypothetical protein
MSVLRPKRLYGDKAVLLRLRQRLREVQAYNPDQPRDANGRWGSGDRDIIKQRHKQLGIDEESLKHPRQLDPEEVKGLQDYAKMLSAHSARYALLAEHGKAYTETVPAPKLGTTKQCYTNAFHGAMDNDDLTYVEGLASTKTIPGFPVEHAWNVNKQGQVVDPTWNDGSAYFGIPFKTDYVQKVAARSGVYGILSHTNMPLLQGKDKGFKASIIRAYNPDEPRDPHGRWGSGDSIDVNQIPKIDYPLSSKQHKIEDAFRAQLAANPKKAKAEYRAKYGNVLNADNAKEMSPDFQKDRGQSLAVHEPASWLVKEMFKEDLLRPVEEGKSNAVLFMAGGAGAGKTTALEGEPSAKAIFDQAHTIMDGTMSSPESAIKKIQQTLNAGKEAVMVYVHRDPVAAFVDGVLKRAEKPNGRTVLVDEVAKQYSGIQDSMQAIKAKFGANPKFAMVVLNNEKAGHAQVTTLNELPKAPRYQELLPLLKSKLEEAYASGKISKRVYDATLGNS